MALGVDGRPLRDPDKIRPGQEYLIPIGTDVRFDDYEVSGYRAPQTTPSAKSWEEEPAQRLVKDVILKTTDFPYGTFELTGPEPPSRVPRDAVAYWLGLHRNEIISAETKWHVSRLAIAGIIAWEALRNPQTKMLRKSVGPGKIHLVKRGQLSYPEVVEYTGRIKAIPAFMRKHELAKPDVAINYIGAILDFVASVPEEKGWNIRNSPEILAQTYHNSTAEEWIKFITTKPRNQPFEIIPGEMGQWTSDNKKYLEAAVGVPSFLLERSR